MQDSISNSFVQSYGGIQMRVEDYETRSVLYRGPVQKLGFGHEMYVEIKNNTKNKNVLKLVETLKSIIEIVSEKDILSVGLIDNMGNKIYQYEKQGV